MKKYFCLLGGLALAGWLLVAVPAHAVMGTGKDFLPDCTGADPYKRGFCTGYIAGVDHLMSTFVEKKKVAKTYCAGEDVTLGKLREVWARWLQDHPEKQEEPANISLLMALKAAFPCDKNK
jgi:hypothetical protein